MGTRGTPTNRTDWSFIMRKYTTATEKAKAIRSEIKTKFGLSSRQVSVKTDGATYDESIHVVAKTIDAMKHYYDIEKLIHKYESIDRDQYSGEILLGGNTYVFMGYDRDALKPYIEAELNFATKVYAEAIEPYQCVQVIGDLIYTPTNVYNDGIIAGECSIKVHRTDHNGRRNVGCATGLAIAIAQYKLFGYFI
jgi:hypothetical protein